MDHIIPPEKDMSNVVLWTGYEAVTSNIVLSQSIKNFKRIICEFAVSRDNSSSQQRFTVELTYPYSGNYCNSVVAYNGSWYENYAGIQVVGDTVLNFFLEYHINWNDPYIVRVIGIK